MLSDFIVVFMLTVITALVSLTIFALCARQSAGPDHFYIKEMLDELNTVIRKLRRDMPGQKWKRRFMLGAVLLFAYIRLKKSNPMGTLDLGIVSLLISLLIAMAGVGFWNFCYILLFG